MLESVSYFSQWYVLYAFDLIYFNYIAFSKLSAAIVFIRRKRYVTPDAIS